MPMSDAPQPDPPVIVTADDLTGACDAGTSILRAGVAVSVIPANASGRSPHTAPSASQITVLDLNCRENAPATIRRKLARASSPFIRRKLARASSPFDPARLRWYHKIDSALRGAVGAQIAAPAPSARRSPHSSISHAPPSPHSFPPILTTPAPRATASTISTAAPSRAPSSATIRSRRCAARA